MKKIISVMLAVSLLSACGMHRKKESVSDWQHASVGNYSQLVPAVKDFVVKGVVFVTSEVVYDENGGKKGSEITNEMLMKEVVKLGGDDIVNVRMDQQEVLTNHDSYKVNPMTNEEKFESRKQNPKKIVYTATGLVIKYTNAITGASSATQGSSLVKPAVTQAVVEKAAAHPHASALLPQKHSVFSHK